VLVAQTGRYDVLRYWLRGPRAGDHEVFIENLPGIPDGISSNGRDTYWLALFTVRNPALDALSGWPRLRKVVFRLPEFLQPRPVRHAFVLGLSLDGEVLHNLQHAGPASFSPVTSATEAGGRLYLGSLERDAFGVLDLARLDQAGDSQAGEQPCRQAASSDQGEQGQEQPGLPGPLLLRVGSLIERLAPLGKAATLVSEPAERQVDARPRIHAQPFASSSGPRLRRRSVI
jgi:hypothetical protein